MTLGAGEILLVVLLLFVAFGPRRPGKPRPAMRTFLVAAIACIAPALILTDRAGAALSLPMKTRLVLVGVTAASAAASLYIARTADRWFERADAKAAKKAASASR